MEISTGKSLKSSGEKIGKSDFPPPLKNFPVTPLQLDRKHRQQGLNLKCFVIFVKILQACFFYDMVWVLSLRKRQPPPAVLKVKFFSEDYSILDIVDGSSFGKMQSSPCTISYYETPSLGDIFHHLKATPLPSYEQLVFWHNFRIPYAPYSFRVKIRIKIRVRN